MSRLSCRYRLACYVAVILLGGLALYPSKTISAGQPLLSNPSADNLEAGDLLWPKPPGALVPFDSRAGAAEASQAAEWEKEKNAYMAKLRKSSRITPDDQARINALAALDYKKFKSVYLGDADPNTTVDYSGGFFYVGHVGIVDIERGIPFVIEALAGQGVRRVSYADWLSERAGQLVWQARLEGISKERRSAVATTAATYLGRPYDFWNFDLADDSGFYCSKLAWLSILKATGSAPDDDPKPQRTLWYSPKRLLRSTHLKILNNPGDYTLK